MPPVTATVVTGVSSSGILDIALARMSTIEGVTMRKVIAKNRFFGPSVSVTGLLTGSDILHALRGKRLGDVLIIPSSALKEEEALFLDGMSLEQLQRQVRAKVVVAEGFKGMMQALRSKGGRAG
jgi:NifB/MoaA-like Fe-S oxidoreductase